MNWGKGITIAIIAFMGFILFMVVKATQTSTDLYAEDYYAQEVNYQATIDAKNNGKKLSGTMDVSFTPEAVLVSFPQELAAHGVQGVVHFYRPDNAAFDKTFPIELTGNTLAIKREQLVVGTYQVKANFSIGEKPYQLELPIQIPINQP